MGQERQLQQEKNITDLNGCLPLKKKQLKLLTSTESFQECGRSKQMITIQSNFNSLN